MRKILLFAFVSLFAGSLSAQLIISAVFDGPLAGGTPKGIELYAYEAVPDLSIFGVGSANNGGGTDGEEFTLSGSAMAGDYIYITANTAEFMTFFGFAATFTTGFMEVNGDDAIELFKDGALFDLFGDPSTDGTGEVWEYLDGWAARNVSDDPSATFDPADWTFSGRNALDGETTNATADTPVPLMQFSLLPVSLSSLTAVSMDKSVMVKWSTATESENDFFAVERSLDGQTFSEIGRVASEGTTTEVSNYDFMDESPANGTSYYRLRQVDLGGSQAIYGPVAVTLTGVSVTAYPNPATQELFLAGLKENTTATVLDISGRVLQSAIVAGNSINVSQLKTGTYLLRLESKTGTETLRFVRK